MTEKQKAFKAVQDMSNYMNKAVETSWQRNEAVTVMYLELANKEAKTVRAYFDGDSE